MKYATSPEPLLSSANSMNISRSVSPLPIPSNYRTDSLAASSKVLRYLRRLVKFNQMDFQVALWQMWYLFVSPQKLYKTASYRKHTKSQFARDDPAFLVLLVISLCVSSFCISVMFSYSWYDRFCFLLYVVFVDFLLVGAVMATIMWLGVNRFFRANQHEADVEWAYCFDIHMNAFFPPSLLLHFFQMFFYNGIISKYRHLVIARLFGNTFWLLAFFYYVYITFLGYNSVPFLKNVRYILSLLPIIFIIYVLTLFIDWNLSVNVMEFYWFRI